MVMVEIEYELTFLAKGIPAQIANAIPKTITDYYLPENNSLHPHLRIRANGNSYEITKKQPVNGIDSSEQTEHTIVLTKGEYTALAKNRKRVVIKDRYNVQINGYMADVDVFKGKLAGLVLIDFEFKTSKQKQAFVAPDICLADVTQEDFIAGGILAGKSYKDISNKLKEFSYEKL